MRIIILGAGLVGQHLSDRLSREGHDVVLIDHDRQKLRRLERELNILPVHGSGASTRTLEDAGIDKADLFIAVTDSDEVNLVACILTRQYGVKTRIARVRNEDFYEGGEPRNEQALGIDLLISPDQALVDEILTLTLRASAFEVAEFGGGEVLLLGYQLCPEAACIDRRLLDLPSLPGLIVAIVRGQTTIIPRGRDTIQAGDRIYLTCRKRDVADLERSLGLTSQRPRRVFIIGGGRIGAAVASRLERQHMEVSLVEESAERCEQLSGELDHTVILNCDGLEINDLLDEGIDHADLVIAVTGSDTTNILASLLAKHHGAQRSITHISRPDFIPLLDRLGIDIALSRRLVAANMILRFVRGGGASIVSAAALLGSDAEVLEVKVPDSPRFRKVELRNLEFPAGAIVGAVVRGQKVIIPKGATRLRPGDNLILFVASGAADAVQQFLAA